MLCFTSPTVKMFRSSRDTARKMAFCTSLVSWYSSTKISRYRAETWRPSSVGALSGPTSSRNARCSWSEKSTVPRRSFSVL